MIARLPANISTAIRWTFVVLLFILSGSTNLTCAQEGTQKATLFDSYGHVGYEDLSARLDNFASVLQNQPDVIGHIVVYGPEGAGFGTGAGMLQVQKEYLTNQRGLDPARVQTTNAGRYKNPSEAFTELWLMPVGATPPQPRHYEKKPKTAKGKFVEFDCYDSLSIEEGEGPSLGSVPFAAFVDTLKQQPRDLAYIVTFNAQGAVTGTWRRVARRQAADLQSRGIEADRIKIIFGGALKTRDKDTLDPHWAIVQLWVLPGDAAPPIKEAKAEAALTEAVQLGSYKDFQLKYPEDERWVFESLADVLKADGLASICLIVRPRTPAAGQDDLPDGPAELPAVDPLKVVEKWKLELTRLGVKESRIILLPATAEESNEGTVEVWVVPAGGALPDPYAHPDVPDPDSTNPPKRLESTS